MILKNGRRIDGCSDTVPVGSLNPFIGEVAPFGYLICQGQLVSKITYPELYDICGSLFGPETATEFYLPDLRGVTIAGYKEGDSLFGTLGGLIGEISHKLTLNEMPAHTHTRGTMEIVGQALLGTSQTNYETVISASGAFSTKTEYVTSDGSSQARDYLTEATSQTYRDDITMKASDAWTGETSSSGGDQAFNIIQPTITMNWIVKAFPLMPNQSTVVNQEINSNSNVYSTNYINALKVAILDSAFPVGKVEVFFDDEDHSNYLGFNWVRELEGLTPVGYKSSDTDYNTIGHTLGSKTHSTTYTPAGKNTGGAVQSHTLTVNEIPSHNHAQRSRGATSNIAAGGGDIGAEFLGTSSSSIGNTFDTGGGSGHSHGFTQPIFTGTQATISMDTRDPQKVVAYWRRVS